MDRVLESDIFELSRFLARMRPLAELMQYELNVLTDPTLTKGRIADYEARCGRRV